MVNHNRQIDPLPPRLAPGSLWSVNQFGHVIPGYKLTLPGGELRLVELEVFDRQSWPAMAGFNSSEESESLGVEDSTPTP